MASRAETRNLLKTAVVGSLLGTAQACSNVPIQTSLVPTCYTVGRNQTCSYNLNIQVSLTQANEVSCLNLNDQAGNPMGQVQIKYEDFYFRAQTSFAYYTSSFTCITEANKDCYTPDNWCGKGRCERIAANDTTASGKLNNALVTTCPGVTKCSRTCGCAGCGCFYCNAACTAFRWALKPVGDGYSVHTLDGTTGVAKITVSELSSGMNVSFSPFAGVSTSFGVFNGTQIGTFNPPTDINLGGFAVARSLTASDPTMYFGPASAKNSPSLLTVGDLQFQSLSQMVCGSTTGSRDAVFDPSIGVSTATAVTCSVPGVSRLEPMPQTRAGYVITKLDPSSAKLTPGLFPPVQVAIVASNLVVTQLVDYVCPEVKFLNITGCYQCRTGFRVYFQVHSKCVSGPAVFSAEQCVPKTVELNSTDGTAFLECQTNSSTLSSTLFVDSNTAQVKTTISGVLNPNSDTGGGVFGDHSSANPGNSIGFSAGFLTDTLLGASSALSSTAKFFLNIFFLVVAAILAFTAIKFLLPMLWDSKRTSTYKKMDEGEPINVKPNSTAKTRRTVSRPN